MSDDDKKTCDCKCKKAECQAGDQAKKCCNGCRCADKKCCKQGKCATCETCKKNGCCQKKCCCANGKQCPVMRNLPLILLTLALGGVAFYYYQNNVKK